MDANTAALSVLSDIRGSVLNDGRAMVFKMFSGAGNAFYYYIDKDSPYLGKIYGSLSDNASKEAAYSAIVSASESDLKCARLTKNGNGWRFRFPDNCSDRLAALDRVEQRIKDKLNRGMVADTLTPVSTYVRTTNPGEIYSGTKERKKPMNDFSLTNLKNALIDKVTHLDKKTVTILSIIALVLLVFCKYKDIKDIFNGIKTKIVNSDNFKEMVSDGTSAVNSLKKIVGVKGANSEA